jgi:hypothetical protein
MSQPNDFFFGFPSSIYFFLPERPTIPVISSISLQVEGGLNLKNFLVIGRVLFSERNKYGNRFRLYVKMMRIEFQAKSFVN